MIRFLRPFDPDRIRLLVFDLDGTLIDSRLDLIHSVNAMLRHIGRPELDGDVIASYVGDGAPALVRRAVGDTDDEALFRRALEYFLGYYRLHKLDHTTVYEGIAEALASVADSQMECGGRWRCSRTSRSIVRAILCRLWGWESSLCAYRAATALRPRSPIRWGCGRSCGRLAWRRMRR